MPLAGAGGGAGPGARASAPTAYCWSEGLYEGTLLAAGGGVPGTVHLWNLQQELCMEQVRGLSLSPLSPAIVAADGACLHRSRCGEQLHSCDLQAMPHWSMIFELR